MKTHSLAYNISSLLLTTLHTMADRRTDRYTYISVVPGKKIMNGKLKMGFTEATRLFV